MRYLVAKPEVWGAVLAGLIRLVFIRPFVQKDEAVNGFPNRVNRALVLITEVVGLREIC